MSEYDAYLDSWHATYPKPAYDHIGLISWEELFGPSGLCPYSTAVDRIIYPKIMSCEFHADEFPDCICEYEDLGGLYNAVIIRDKKAWEAYHAPAPFAAWQTWNR